MKKMNAFSNQNFFIKNFDSCLWKKKERNVRCQRARFITTLPKISAAVKEMPII